MDDSKSEKPKKRGNPAWVKGCKSPNPAGKPKKRAELMESIQRRGLDLVVKLFEIADKFPVAVLDDEGKQIDIEGPSHRERIEAVKTLLAYGYGKPTEHVELTGNEGGPIEVSSVSRMTSGQRRKRLDELLAKARRKDNADGSGSTTE
jgi:hypothetical protein